MRHVGEGSTWPGQPLELEVTDNPVFLELLCSGSDRLYISERIDADY
jgi:hypothetical protein